MQNLSLCLAARCGFGFFGLFRRLAFALPRPRCAPETVGKLLVSLRSILVPYSGEVARDQRPREAANHRHDIADTIALHPSRIVRSNSVQHSIPCLRSTIGGMHNTLMRKGDVICPQCKAGFRRIELVSQPGTTREFRCPICDHVLELSDGSTEIAYRLTVAPEKLFE